VAAQHFGIGPPQPENLRLLSRSRTPRGFSVLVAGHGWMSAPDRDCFAGMGSRASNTGRALLPDGGEQARGRGRAWMLIYQQSTGVANIHPDW
jgi:hypothetical protein